MSDVPHPGFVGLITHTVHVCDTEVYGRPRICRPRRNARDLEAAREARGLIEVGPELPLVGAVSREMKGRIHAQTCARVHKRRAACRKRELRALARAYSAERLPSRGRRRISYCTHNTVVDVLEGACLLVEEQENTIVALHALLHHALRLQAIARRVKEKQWSRHSGAVNSGR